MTKNLICPQIRLTKTLCIWGSDAASGFSPPGIWEFSKPLSNQGGKLCPPHYCLPTRIWKPSGISLRCWKMANKQSGPSKDMSADIYLKRFRKEPKYFLLKYYNFRFFKSNTSCRIQKIWNLCLKHRIH